MFSKVFNVVKKTVSAVRELQKQSTEAWEEESFQNDLIFLNSKARSMTVSQILRSDLPTAQVAVPAKRFRLPFNRHAKSTPHLSVHIRTEVFCSEQDILLDLRVPAWFQFSITEAERSTVVAEDPTMSFPQVLGSAQLSLFGILGSVGEALERGMTHRVIAQFVHTCPQLAHGKTDFLPP